MPQVTVDLNKTRIQAAEKLNAITKLLNHYTDNEGIVNMYVGEIHVEMQSLRMCIASLCHSYIEESEAYANISGQISEFVDFNPNNY